MREFKVEFVDMDSDSPTRTGYITVDSSMIKDANKVCELYTTGMLLGKKLIPWDEVYDNFEKYVPNARPVYVVVPNTGTVRIVSLRKELV